MRPDKPKPTKSELLAELESIRYSLSEEEIEQLMQQDDFEIPVLVEPVSLTEDAGPDQAISDEAAAVTLTAIDAVSDDDLIFDDSGPRARTETPIPSSRTSDTADEKEPPDSTFFPGESDEDDWRVSEKSVVFSSAEPDSPETTITMDEKPDVFEPSAGQQSLFDQPASARQWTRPEKNKIPASSPAPGDENPFLPKHIRDRLSLGRSTIMDELMQVGDSLNRDKSQFQYSPTNTGTSASLDAPTHPTPVLHSSKQTDRIVEELVAEYLPRMEAELRKRLREQLSTNKHKTADPEISS